MISSKGILFFYYYYFILFYEVTSEFHPWSLNFIEALDTSKVLNHNMVLTLHNTEEINVVYL